MKYKFGDEIINIDNVILNARLESVKTIRGEYKLFIICAKGQINEDDVPILYRRKKIKNIRYWNTYDEESWYVDPNDNKPKNKNGWIRPRIENEEYRYLEFHLEYNNEYSDEFEDYWEIVPNDFDTLIDLCYYFAYEYNAANRIYLYKTQLAFELTRNNQKILNRLPFKLEYPCRLSEDPEDPDDSIYNRFSTLFGIRIL